MKTRRKTLLTAIAAGAGLMLGCHAASAQPAPPPLTQEQIKQIVASPDRSAADRTNDQRRKPEEMLVFIGIRPGITALDLSAAGGYTTELLARAIGPTGVVYGQSRPRDPSRAPTPPAAPRGQQQSDRPVRRGSCGDAGRPDWRAAPVARRPGRPRQRSPKRRRPGRADRRRRPAVRGSHSARTRGVRSGDPDVQLS